MSHEIERNLKVALAEIGDIKPWKEEGGYYFRHDTYPVVDYMADTPQDTIKGYKRILREFIEDRLQGNLSSLAERTTSGRGGKRPGAGRPTSQSSTRISIPDDILDVVNWLREDPKRANKVRTLMRLKT